MGSALGAQAKLGRETPLGNQSRVSADDPGHAVDFAQGGHPNVAAEVREQCDVRPRKLCADSAARSENVTSSGVMAVRRMTLGCAETAKRQVFRRAKLERGGRPSEEPVRCPSGMSSGARWIRS